MTRIILIRHGQSMANLREIFVGHTDVPLTDTGRKQAEMTAEYVASAFSVDKVYASDLQRAYDTAKALANKLHTVVVPECGMREIDGGEWENIPFLDLISCCGEQYDTWLHNIGNAACPGGESVAQLMERVVATVKRLGRENEGKTIAIGTHATPIRVLQCHCEGKPLAAMQTIPYVPNASVTTVLYEDDRLTMTEAGNDLHLGDLRTELPKNV